MYTNIAIDVYGWTAWNIACTCVVYYVRSETNKRMNEVAHWSSLQRSSNRMHIIWTTLNNSRNFPTDARWELYEDDNDNADNNNNNPFRHHFLSFCTLYVGNSIQVLLKAISTLLLLAKNKRKMNSNFYFRRWWNRLQLLLSPIWGFNICSLISFSDKKNCFFLFFAFSYFSNINSHCYLNRTHFVFTSIHHLKKWLSNSEVCK